MPSAESGRLPTSRSARRLPVARRGSWPLTGALWLCVVASATGFGPMLVAARWWFLAALVAAVIVAVTALVRMTRLPGALAAFSGPVTYVLVLTWVFAPGTTVFLVPTPDTVTALVDLFQEGVTSIYRQTMPAVVEPGLLLILVAGVGLIAVVFDLVVFSLGVPAAAGILLLVVLAIPVVVQGTRANGVVFVATAVSFLLLLRADMLRRRTNVAQPPGRRTAGRRGVDDRPSVTGGKTLSLGRQTVVIAAVSLVGAMLLGAVLPGFDRPPPAPTTGNITIFGGGINPIISLGKNLRQPSEAVMLTYTSTAVEPLYLSVITLDRFTGDNWAPTLREPDPTRPVTRIDPIPGLADQTPRGYDVVTDITIDNLVSRWLPLPYPSRSVRIGDPDWFWEPSDLSVSGDQPTSRGLSYSATSVQPKPTVEQLSSAPDPVDSQRYRALPNDVPTIISDTADTVTASAASQYEQAVMLQKYFRGNTFSYSLEAPVEQGYDGDGMAVLGEFLTMRSGYCVHFASAMAVMARSLGIPARIAVGYQPGTPVSSAETAPATSAQEYEVSSADLHAWPQLYFEGVGWLNFDPTPSRGDPAPYTRADASRTPDDGAAASAAPSPGASAAPSHAPGRTPLDVGEMPLPGVGPSTSNWVPAVVLLAILVLLLLPAAARSTIRALRLRPTADARESAVRAWQEIVASAADLAVPLPSTRTPRQVQSELVTVLPADDDARQALTRTVRAVEHAFFAATPVEFPVAPARDARIILQALRRSLPFTRRVRAVFLPVSLTSSQMEARATDA